MSRIGKKIIKIPEGVEIKFNDGILNVKGPKGILNQNIHPFIIISQENNTIKLTVKNPEENEDKALWGLFGSLIKNMIIGVTNGYEKKLEIRGVGYKVIASGNKLILNVGFSHTVEFKLPDGIIAEVDKTFFTLKGIDKQLVGQVSANIRKIKKPEPYKGKGIRYVDEVVKEKAGKTASS